MLDWSLFRNSGLEVSHVVNERVWVALADSAHVVSSFHLEVAIDSPRSSPRVLDVPETCSLFNSVTSGEDGVVDIHGSSSTVVDCVDTSGIVLESSDNLEWNWDGASVVKSLSKFSLITLGDVVAAVPDIGDGDFRSVNTRKGQSLIRISGISFKAANVFNILEGMGRKSSVASVVVEISSTVNKLLFRESQVSSLSENVPVGLHGTDSGESPARSAWSLVLNGWDHAQIIPFVVRGDSSLRNFVLDLESAGGRALLRGHQSVLLEFFESHVREIVDSLNPRVVSRVVLLDFFQSWVEDLESVVRSFKVRRSEFKINLLSNSFR